MYKKVPYKIKRQGDRLSTILFDLVLKTIVTKAEINTNGRIINKKYQRIAHADDVTVIGTLKEGLLKIRGRTMNQQGSIG